MGVNGEVGGGPGVMDAPRYATDEAQDLSNTFGDRITAAATRLRWLASRLETEAPNPDTAKEVSERADEIGQELWQLWDEMTDWQAAQADERRAARKAGRLRTLIGSISPVRLAGDATGHGHPIP